MRHSALARLRRRRLARGSLQGFQLCLNKLFLPAFAGVAQYHGKLKGALGKSPEAAREAAEAFVEEDYLRALHRGAGLDGKARERIVRRIAELTGLAGLDPPELAEIIQRLETPPATG